MEHGLTGFTSSKRTKNLSSVYCTRAHLSSVGADRVSRTPRPGRDWPRRWCCTDAPLTTGALSLCSFDLVNKFTSYIFLKNEKKILVWRNILLFPSPASECLVFIFHLAFVQAPEVWIFILFVYRRQQRLMGILSVATGELGVHKEVLCCRLIRVKHPL